MPTPLHRPLIALRPLTPLQPLLHPRPPPSRSPQPPRHQKPHAELHHHIRRRDAVAHQEPARAGSKRLLQPVHGFLDVGRHAGFHVCERGRVRGTEGGREGPPRVQDGEREEHEGCFGGVDPCLYLGAEVGVRGDQAGRGVVFLAEVSKGVGWTVNRSMFLQRGKEGGPGRRIMTEKID